MPEATESQARSAAQKAGLVARKCHLYDGLNYRGGFMLVDPMTGFPVWGWYYDLTPVEVVEYCTTD